MLLSDEIVAVWDLFWSLDLSLLQARKITLVRINAESKDLNDHLFGLGAFMKYVQFVFLFSLRDLVVNIFRILVAEEINRL